MLQFAGDSPFCYLACRCDERVDEYGMCRWLSSAVRKNWLALPKAPISSRRPCSHNLKKKKNSLAGLEEARQRRYVLLLTASQETCVSSRIKGLHCRHGIWNTEIQNTSYLLMKSSTWCIRQRARWPWRRGKYVHLEEAWRRRQWEIHESCARSLKMTALKEVWPISRAHSLSKEKLLPALTEVPPQSQCSWLPR